MKANLSGDLKKIIYDVGETAIYKGRNIKVIFNDIGEIGEIRFLRSDRAVVSYEYEEITAVCFVDDVSDVNEGDEIVIGGKKYYVSKIKRKNSEVELILSEDNLNG